MATALDARYNALVSSFLYGQAVIRWANDRAKVIDSELMHDQMFGELGDVGGLSRDSLLKVNEYLEITKKTVQESVAASVDSVLVPPSDVALLDYATYGGPDFPREFDETISEGMEVIARLLSGPDALALYPYIFKINVVTQPVGEYVRGGLLAMSLGVLEKCMSEIADVEEGRPSSVPTSVSNLSALLSKASERLKKSFNDDDSLTKDVTNIYELRNSIVHREGRVDERLLKKYTSDTVRDGAGAFISLTATELDSMIQTVTGFGLRVIFASWAQVTSDRAYVSVVVASSKMVLKGTSSMNASRIIEDLT